MQSRKVLSKSITEVVDIELSAKEFKAVLPRSQKHKARHAWTQDPWLTVTILAAYIVSISAFWYFFQKHQIVLYGDTYAHMLIVRRVFDVRA